MNTLVFTFEELLMLLAGIGIPLIGGISYCFKCYMNNVKEKLILQKEIEQLKSNDTGARKAHSQYDAEIKDIQKKVKELCNKTERQSGWIKMILKHLKIPFPEDH